MRSTRRRGGGRRGGLGDFGGSEGLEGPARATGRLGRVFGERGAVRASRSRVRGVPVEGEEGAEVVRRERRRAGDVPRNGRSVRDFFVTGGSAGEVSSTFLNFGLFEDFGPNLGNYFQGSFLVLVHIVLTVFTIVLTVN